MNPVLHCIFSHLLCNVRAKNCLSLHARAGETTSFWKQQALMGWYPDSLCFHVFPAFPMESGSHKVFEDSAYCSALPPHPPWLLAIKSPLSTRYLLYRIIIYQALHFLLMKQSHHIFDKHLVLPKPGNTSTNKQTNCCYLQRKSWKDSQAGLHLLKSTAPWHRSCRG